MGTKTIALDEKSYNSLSSLKKNDESFSDLVKRLTRPIKPLASFSGAWKDMPSKMKADIKSLVDEIKNRDRERLEQLVKKVTK